MKAEVRDPAADIGPVAIVSHARIDTFSVDDTIASVPEGKATRAASRYDAVIATFVGLCALCVSGYTAYMQRQQVRAAVWPILEFDSSNAPDIHFTLSNKGVGPALIRHVIVKVDDQPVRNWNEVFEKILGPGKYHGSESDMSGHVFSAGESINVFTPHDPNDNPVNLEWCFERGRKPSEEEIKIWNAFLVKRGWRDEASADLQAAKKREGLEDRDDVQTWVDLHDVEEGRTPRLFSSG